MVSTGQRIASTTNSVSSRKRTRKWDEANIQRGAACSSSAMGHKLDEVDCESSSTVRYSAVQSNTVHAIRRVPLVMMRQVVRVSSLRHGRASNTAAHAASVTSWDLCKWSDTRRPWPGDSPSGCAATAASCWEFPCMGSWEEAASDGASSHGSFAPSPVELPRPTLTCEWDMRSCGAAST